MPQTPSVPEVMQQALSLHQAGDLASAEVMYRRILAANPREPNALHLLGVLSGQRKQFDSAIQLIGQAIALKPDSADFHRNLGRIWADQGDFTRAVACYERSAQLSPDNPEAWCVLGAALAESANFTAAVSSLCRAMLLNPRYKRAALEINRLLPQLDPAPPLVDLARSFLAQPLDPLIYARFARAVIDHLPDAEAWYRRLIVLNPGNPHIRIFAGDWLLRHIRSSEAFAAYSAAIELAPDLAGGYTARGKLLTESGDLAGAETDHRKAVALAPNSSAAHLGLGTALEAMREASGAEVHLRRAVELDPLSAEAWASLGSLLRTRGGFTEAADCFRRSLKLKPNAGVSMLLTTITRGIDVEELNRLTTEWKRGDLPPVERLAIGFALGKVLDEADQFDQAFECYFTANSVYRDMWASRGKRFDPIDRHRLVDEMIEVYAPDFFKARADWGNPTEIPVFIVGMPRSGTTLVEQICASHSKVFGAGERMDFNGYAAALETTRNQKNARNWKRSQLAHLAAAHIQKMTELGGTSQRVIDKLPANLTNIGLIATLFPRARIIVCQRDARDNCLSCYFQLFYGSTQIFSYDLGHCAVQFREMNRLADHWLKNAPVQMMSLQYETLVNDLEGQSRRLIEFLGLEWEPACQEFHKNQRTVSTASFWQVRQPIYTKSVGRWKHYEKHLGPLIAALGDQADSLGSVAK